MSSTIPIGPTIPNSTESRIIISDNLNSDIIIGESITDNVATLSGGYLSNLTTASNPQEVANRGQVAANAFPGGVANSIQYNKNGFAGSNNLTFSGGTLTVNSGTIADQTGMTLNPSGIISNVVDPVVDSSIATKKFVDSLSSTKNISNIDNNAGVVWTASQMYGVIVRNRASGVTEETVTDTTPTAAQIIAAFPGNPVVGSTFRFNLLNDNIRAMGGTPGVDSLFDNFKVSFTAGSGVTIEPSGSFIVPRSHTLDSFVIFDNVGVGTEAVTIHINSIDWIPKSFFFKPVNSVVETALNLGPTEVLSGVDFTVTGNVFTNQDLSTTVNTTTYEYTESNVAKGLIIRQQIGASTDTISNNFLISVYPNQLFRIVNNGSGTITINPDTQQTFYPNPITIESGRTGLLAFVPITTDFYTITAYGSGYDVDAAVTISGGTGSGFAIDLLAVVSVFLVGVAGSGYTTGVHTTTALTGGGSGLTLNIVGLDGSNGVVSFTPNIFNTAYLTSLGYANGDLIGIDGPGSGAVIGLNMDTVLYFNVTDWGSGYSPSDVLTINQAGSDNGSTFTLSSSKLISVIQFGNATN